MTLVILATVATGMNINHDRTSIVTGNNEAAPVISNNDKKDVEIYGDETKEDTTQTPIPENKEIKFTVLGEMMMGGEVTKNTSYLYKSAFKEIFNFTRNSDFTYASFSTNITNLEKINDPKTKYIVTKDIANAFTSLGVDAVNVASDHMTDYPQDIFKNTLNILKENNTYVAGLNNSILYLEKNSKKIAIVAANNVFIGTKNNYADYGINVYEEAKMKNDIAEASQSADFVIVDIHWGREYIFGVTEEMKKIAYAAINNGADLVMGSHALGVYPVITYKGVPIIYSTGYVMTDSNSELNKKSYIFDININAENKIKSIEMNPIYIDGKKEVKPYYEYNKEFCNVFNTQMNTWNKNNNLNSEIVDNRIVITF